MPTESDYALGREAVKRNIVTQEQLEECIELLFALEKVGSKKNLADVIADRGYATREQLENLESELKGEEEEKPLFEGIEEPPKLELEKEPTPEPTVPKPSVSQIKTEPVPPNPSEYCFIQLSNDHKVSLRVLPKKPVAIGRDPSNDIVVLEGPVSKRHARLTFSPDGITIWDVGSKNGTFVNGEKVTSRKLSSGDVISIGSWYFVFSHVDRPDGAIIGTITPDAAEQEAVAVLSGQEGFGKGATFYIGSRPFFIGSDPVCNLPLEGDDIHPLHAQIFSTPKGVRIVDLNSESGILINGRPQKTTLLDEGDVIQIGNYVLRVESVKVKPQREETRPRRTAAPTPVPVSKPKPKPEPPPKPAPPKKPIDEEATIITSKEELKEAAEAEDVLFDLGEALRAEAGLAPLERETPEKVSLVCIAGLLKGESFALSDKPLTIGRNPKASIFLKDLSVSREHAMIKRTGGKIEVIDLGSRNGVFVNGKRVMSKVLATGDKITIGKSTFILKEE